MQLLTGLSWQRDSSDGGEHVTVLLSCFEPFGGDSINSSQETIRALSSTRRDLHFLVLPTVFSRAGEVILSKIESLKPELVIMLGEASGRSSISLEKIALNFMDARIPDNDGLQPSHKVIEENRPLALQSNLPLEKLCRALIDDGIPVTISYSAGTFVCNLVFYEVLNYSAQIGNMRAGFLHLPLCEKQALRRPNVPFLQTRIAARATELIIDRCTRRQ